MTLHKDRLSQLWDMQLEFTERFWETLGGMPKTPEQLAAVTKDYVIHLLREGTEVLDEVPWKMHRAPTKEIDRGNVLEELVDCQKYLWGLMQLWKVTDQEFADEFRRKSMVVEQRFAQERDFPKLANDLVAIVDIDGVLADYPRCFYRWMAERGYAPTVAQSKAMYERLPLRDRESVKREYRMSGAKRTLPSLPGASELLKLIRSRGLKVVLMTNRPYAEHYRIYPDTLEWLAVNDMEYDAILWARDKGLEAVKNFRNICWAVDDSDENIRRLTEAGITTIKVNPYDEERNTASLLRAAQSCQKIEDLGHDVNTMLMQIEEKP